MSRAYSASSSAFTPGATPQDIFTITGGPNVTVRVLRVTIAFTQTTAGVNAVTLKRRSTANTGGTSAGLTEIPHNSGDSAAVATVLEYTANPTAGTAVGDVWTGFVASPAAATAGIGSAVENVEFSGAPVILRGTGEVLAVNLGGVTLPIGLVCRISVMWTEE